MEGRSTLNFSEWTKSQSQLCKIDEVYEVIQEGKIPPATYTQLHPEANLSIAEKCPN